MRLLLDTHALVWWLLDDPRLSDRARRTIISGRAEILVSPASGYEIAYKYRAGRWNDAPGVLRYISHHLSDERLWELPIRLEHTIAAGHLDTPHRDPFDRLLAAQSIVENAPMVTRDRALAACGATTIW